MEMQSSLDLKLQNVIVDLDDAIFERDIAFGVLFILAALYVYVFDCDILCNDGGEFLEPV
jgi:hypothetical protein